MPKSKTKRPIKKNLVCCNCGRNINNELQRRKLTAKIKSQNCQISSIDALKALGIEFGPGEGRRHLICPVCAKILGKLSNAIGSLKALLSTLKEVTNDAHTPVGYKIKRVLEGSADGEFYFKAKRKRRKTKTGSSDDGSCIIDTPLSQDQIMDIFPHVASDLPPDRYKKVMKHIKSSKSLDSFMIESVCKKISAEMKSGQSIFSIDAECKTKSMEKYSWRAAHRSLKVRCPTLMNILESTLERKPVRNDNNRLTMTAAHLFFIRSSRQRICQELIGRLLWYAGTNRKTFLRLSRLGLCSCIKTTRDSINSLKSELNDTIDQQKQRIAELQSTDRKAMMKPSSDDWTEVENWETEQGLFDTQNDHHGDSRTMVPQAGAVVEVVDADTPIDLGGNSQVMISRNGEVVEVSVVTTMESQDDSQAAQTEKENKADDTPASPLGFTLTFDTVNQTLPKFQPSEGKLTKEVNFLNSYGEIDRVPCFHLSDEPPSLEQLSSIGEDVFLPSTGDIDMLRYEYEVMISRILCNHIPCFKDMCIMEQIPHPYLEEMKKKSILVPLGVLEKDETKLSEMIDALDHWHKYVPGQKSPIPMVLYGSAQSCDRVRDAIGARRNADTPWSRLSGLMPSAQEWHKRKLLLEDTYKLLYDAKSVKSCGSLSYVRDTYMRTYATAKVDVSFEPLTNLLRFTTEAYVLAAACEYMGIQKLSDTPKDLPEDPDELSSYFSNTCKYVLEMSFHPYQIGDSAKGIKTLNQGDAMELDEDEGPFCVCKETKRKGRMIRCAYESCEKGKWFHHECMRLKQSKIPKGDWFCSIRCRRQHQQKGGGEQERPKDDVDSKYEYSKALLHLGLGEMVRHDAIREGDGNRMIQHWLLDLPHFFDKHHSKYFSEGHQLLMNVNGGVSDRLAYQMKWNRTVNVYGGEGKNVGKDYGMESMNKDFMSVLRDTSSNFSKDLVISRYSQVVVMEETVNRSFDIKVTGRPTPTAPDAAHIKASDTVDLAELLVKNRCLVNVPGRSHTGFEDFKFQQRVDLERYRAKISALKEKRLKQAKFAKLME
ncbi:uncharacterized protein LOC121407753 [Lytechinus variegatus]|uniref:uncharacterized protein LOC121407753 n=1 Tax=Lytechinus variegatus TaxID=7654 RepID=UPI001BB1F429|nr:uncharacterized protein LOC121407753 [Lytechinus variegatus]